MKIAVIGSRGYNNYNEFCEMLEYFIQNLGEVTFVSGAAKSGGDALIARYCKENNLPLIEFPADWNNLGKKAGFIRNKQIIDEAEGVIAFWDLKSKGTEHSILLARKKGIKIKIVEI